LPKLVPLLPQVVAIVVVPFKIVITSRLQSARDLLLSSAVRSAFPILRINPPKWDNGNAFLAIQTLNLLLPLDGIADVAIFFEVHQAVDVVFLRESFYLTALVLCDSACDVVCHPGVNTPGAPLIRRLCE
jgi:hypothetical protein